MNPPETNGLTIACFFGTFIVSLGGGITGLVTTGGTAEGGDVFGEIGGRSRTGGCIEGRTYF
jgi:hypothetical protein